MPDFHDTRLPERFWSHTEVAADGCWHWKGQRSGHGYGRFYHGGRTHQAHRLAYELLVGPIPEPLVCDHLCRVRHCVNPAHIEIVTLAENTRRGYVPQPRQTHCKRGHDLTPENTQARPNGDRFCKACSERNNTIRRRKLRAARYGGGADKIVMKYRPRGGSPVPGGFIDPFGDMWAKTGNYILDSRNALG